MAGVITLTVVPVMYQDCGLEHNLRLFATKLALGRMLYENGNFHEAARHYTFAFDLADESGLSQDLVARSALGLAKCYVAFGDFAKAEGYLRQALTADEALGPSLVEEAEDYHQLALLYWRSGKPELSYESAQKAWNLCERDKNTPDELKAKLLKHFAVLEEQAGNLDQSECYLNRAIDLIEGSGQLGNQSSIYGDALLVKVLLFVKQGKVKEASELYPHAMQTVQINRGPHHPRVEDVLTIFQEFEDKSFLSLSPEQLRDLVCRLECKTKHGII